MPIQVRSEGSNNSVLIDPEFAERGEGRITLTGDNNTVLIGEPQASTGAIDIQVAGGSSLSIAVGCLLGHLFVYMSNRGVVRIGHTTRFNGQVRLLLHEPGTIAIGSGCLFGGGVDVTVSDMHSIVAIDTGLRVNPARDVQIGDDVWVGQNATILKGVSIGNGSIVGASAVVTGDVPATCAVAGNPARVVREGVTWREDLI